MLTSNIGVQVSGIDANADSDISDRDSHWTDPLSGLFKFHNVSICSPLTASGLVVKASASRADDPVFESRLRRKFFRGRVIAVT